MLYSLDVPGTPSSPEVATKSSDSVTLFWSAPDKDGGSPIQGYIIEIQDEGATEWKRLNEQDKLSLTTQFTVPNLEENKECRFRIIAVNAVGESDPSARSNVVVVQDIQGISI